jgi:hypothetical protein
MSIILQQPDALSFSGNLKTFEVTSGAVVNFGLMNDGVLVLDEKYRPTAGAVSIDVKDVVDRLLSVSFPSSGITDQVSAVGNFTATIDGATATFRVVKGGVDKMQETAGQFVDSHILSWQSQDKETTQYRPEWLTFYAKETRKLKARVYYINNAPVDLLLQTLPANKLSTVDVCWGAVNSACTVKNPVAWDLWSEDISGNRLSYVQRYRLRNPKETDKVFVWANTLGGWDTVSFNGASEHDRKLEHQVAQGGDGSFTEYQVNKNSGTKQSTGYLTLRESLWLEDFFYSKKRYVILGDGSVSPIVLTDSKVVSSSVEDMFDFEFTYRLATENQLLNLDRTYGPLPVPEAPGDFFLAELLSGLTSAQFSDSLLLAVQSPFARGWQKLTIAQLLSAYRSNISAELPLFKPNETTLKLQFDTKTLGIVDGRLTVTGGASTLSGNTVPDTRTMLLTGAVTWEAGMGYRSTKLVYKILGQDYQVAPQTLTIDSADATLPRIDIFVADASSVLSVLKGAPATNPLKPMAATGQLEVTQVYIPANASQPEVAVELVYDENGEWAASQTHDANINVDFEATAGHLSGIRHIEIGIAIPDTTLATPTHFVGERYQGGIIFYLDHGGKSGLIAAETIAGTDLYESLGGSGPYGTGATATNIGAGGTNTLILLAHQLAKDCAAKVASNCSYGGYHDWFLGAQQEMEQLAFRKSLFPNLTGTFWTSTETAWNKAYCVSLDNGVTYERLKNNSYNVVPVRKFDDTTATANVPVETYSPVSTALVFAAPQPVDITSGILSFYLKSSSDWMANTSLLVEMYNGGTRIGFVVVSKMAGLFGFNPASPNWQQVALQASMFSPTGKIINILKISPLNSWPNNIVLGIDKIRIQHDVAQTVDVPKQGVYGSPTKHAIITIDPLGKITKIEEVYTALNKEQLTGAVNGANKTFNTSVAYAPGSVMLYVNGLKDRGYTETGSTEVTLDEAPLNRGFSDIVEAIFIKQ